MKLIATQSADVSVTFRNDNGFPVDVQGDVIWTSSHEGVASVVADADDSSKATITAGLSNSTATISATADADLGEGVSPVTATIIVQVLARGEAVGGEIDVVTKDQGLPSQPPIPGHDLPGTPNKPSNELPGTPNKPDNSLPGGAAKPK